MLVLSRRAGEAVVIDGRVRVHVGRICGGRVRLAIEAPPGVQVDRLEVWREKSRDVTTDLQVRHAMQASDGCQRTQGNEKSQS